jgi:multisubunit Na+/H+ antiporter MnhG subunit
MLVSGSLGLLRLKIFYQRARPTLRPTLGTFFMLVGSTTASR